MTVMDPITWGLIVGAFAIICELAVIAHIRKH